VRSSFPVAYGFSGGVKSVINDANETTPGSKISGANLLDWN
jgi:hypothetical protein